ncbi:hypothetical protein [Synechococcus sp. CS-1333]|uniref:hypothetical protein n=1 Tax=Synechococcus sp. CS-1333 TaxID=2848638 RepID=UPI00223BC25D|nr:hypothetical protein [Synechococcus sp. CS-1333]
MAPESNDHGRRAADDEAVLAQLSLLDRFLPLWILLAMGGGLLLGRFFPAIQGWLDAVRIGNTSLPIALGLLLMMYPVLAKVHYEELGRAARDRRLLRLSLVSAKTVDTCRVMAMNQQSHQPSQLASAVDGRKSSS